MGILFDTCAQLISTGSATVTPLRFHALRDWRCQHLAGFSYNQAPPCDLDWSSTDRVRSILQGPLGIQNQIFVESGTAHLEGVVSPDSVFSGSASIGLCCWINLIDHPTTGDGVTNGTVFNVALIFDSSTNRFFALDLAVTTTGIFLEASTGILGSSRSAVRHTVAPDDSNWVFVTASFDRTNNNTKIYNGDTVQTLSLTLANADLDRLRIANGNGFGGGNIKNLRIANFFVSQLQLTSTLVLDAIAAITNQNQLEDYFVNNWPDVSRYYRGSDFDVGADYGDMHIHDVSSYMHAGKAHGGTLSRSLTPGPLDAANAYNFAHGCTVITNPRQTPVTDWGFSMVLFYRHLDTHVAKSSWFFRIETDAGEVLQLERFTAVAGGYYARLKIFRADIPGTSITLNISGTPLFDEDWHAVLFTAGNTPSRWNFYVDENPYLPAMPSVPAQIGNVTAIKFGNIDCNLSTICWANYYDTGLLSAVLSATTQDDILDYCKSGSYSGMYPLLSTLPASG